MSGCRCRKGRDNACACGTERPQLGQGIDDVSLSTLTREPQFSRVSATVLRGAFSYQGKERELCSGTDFPPTHMRLVLEVTL